MTTNPPRKFYSSNRDLAKTILTKSTQEPKIQLKKNSFDETETIAVKIAPKEFASNEKKVEKTPLDILQEKGLKRMDNKTVSSPFEVLVEWALTPENTEGDFTKMFFLNYHSYKKAIELFDIVNQFPKDIVLVGDAEKDKYGKQRWIKFTIFMKTWIDMCPNDFENEELKSAIFGFVDRYISSFPGIKPIKKMVEMAKSKIKLPVYEEIEKVMGTPYGNEKCKSLKELSVEEIVSQLGIYEYILFSTIQTGEFLGSGWTKKDKYDRCPRLCKFLDHFNAVTNWVCSSILDEKDINERAKIIDKCIEVTLKMREDSNYTGFFEFYSGLNSSSISRLTKTWDLCKHKAKMDELNNLANPTKSYAMYRGEIKGKETNSCMVPFMGVIIQDLTFIDEGNPDELEKGIVNFEKCRMMADLLLDIQKWQQTLYKKHKLLPFFKDFIQTLDSHKDDDDKKLYDISLQIQPRGQ